MIIRLLAAACVWVSIAPNLLAADSPPASAPRSLTAIRTDVSDALRAEATTRKSGDNTPQVMRLADLYLEMAGHPRRDTSPLLNDLGQQVRIRLQTVRDRVERRVADKSPSAKKTVKLAKVTIQHNDHVLAQQVLPAGAPGAAANQRGGAAQGAAVAVAPTPVARPTDFGPELVELIEAVVSPSTWRINGGNGAVVYYSPLHVLVVSAPDDVHAQVAGVLQQLNAAQRKQDGEQVVTGVVSGHAGEVGQ
jgi:hypothetical protein